MRRRHVLVRHLDAVEALGGVQAFCLDKTGTLTENRMQVERVILGTDDGRLSGGRHLVAAKGSPTDLLARCDYLLDEAIALDDETREAVRKQNERMAADALRVLGVAYRITDEAQARRTRRLVWLGLVGMTDPLRAGMAELMRALHQAGINTVMITGDQSATAQALGRAHHSPCRPLA